MAAKTATDKTSRPAQEIETSWHIGPDDKAHYIRDGKALCGHPGVDATCPRLRRFADTPSAGFVEPVCWSCRTKRSEVR